MLLRKLIFIIFSFFYSCIFILQVSVSYMTVGPASLSYNLLFTRKSYIPDITQNVHIKLQTLVLINLEPNSNSTQYTTLFIPTTIFSLSSPFSPQLILLQTQLLPSMQHYPCFRSYLLFLLSSFSYKLDQSPLQCSLPIGEPVKQSPAHSVSRTVADSDVTLPDTARKSFRLITNFSSHSTQIINENS